MLTRVAVRLIPWLVAVGTFGGLTYDRLVSEGFTRFEQRRGDAIVLARAAIASQLTALRGDLFLIARHPATRGVLETPTDSTLARLERLMTLVMEVRGDYDQGRWIDETGWERVRCDLFNSRQEINDVRCLPPIALQSKADRYYVADANRLPAGAIYVSPIDLNLEHGVVEVPDKPVLRLATTLWDSAGRRRGILILNALMRDMLDALRELRSTVGVDLYLVDGRGNWLIGEKPDDAFANQRGHPENTLFNRYPVTAARMRADGADRLTDSEGAWNLSAIPVGELLGTPSDGPDRDPVLWLLAHTSADELAQVRRSAQLKTIPLVLALCVIVFVFSYRYARLAKDRDVASAAAIRQADQLARMNRELKDALARGAAMRDELVDAQKLSSIGLMVAGVAHELNTPIGAALMAATALKKTLETHPETADTAALPARMDTGLRLILGNLSRVAERIARLRRLSVDRASADRRRFRLRDVVDDVRHDLAHRMALARVEVRCDIPATIELDSYPGPLGQVLENLLINAEVHAFDQRAGRRLELSAVPDEKHVLITVADNGKGIAAEHLPHLFDPFFTTRRGEQRMGLGLYLVRRFVTELLGGQLSVSSRVGEGTCFTLLLPLVAEAAAPAATTPLTPADPVA